MKCQAATPCNGSSLGFWPRSHLFLALHIPAFGPFPPPHGCLPLSVMRNRLANLCYSCAATQLLSLPLSNEPKHSNAIHFILYIYLSFAQICSYSFSCCWFLQACSASLCTQCSRSKPNLAHLLIPT